MMNKDFIRVSQNGEEEIVRPKPFVPESAYQSIKRCKYCNSVYITESSCEECGRSFHYHVIGEPFSFKSFYGLKEKYVEGLPYKVRLFSSLEKTDSIETKRYLKKLDKRFDDLVDAYVAMDEVVIKNARLFYIELQALVDELLRYGASPDILIQIVETKLMEESFPQMGQELVSYIKGAALGSKLREQNITVGGFWSYRLMGMSVEAFIISLMVAAAFMAAALVYYSYFLVR